jgi:hypothetical protein
MPSRAALGGRGCDLVRGGRPGRRDLRQGARRPDVAETLRAVDLAAGEQATVRPVGQTARVLVVVAEQQEGAVRETAAAHHRHVPGTEAQAHIHRDQVLGGR